MNFFSLKAAFQRTLVITRKELCSWLFSPALYGIAVFFLLFISIWFYYLQSFFAMNTATLIPFVEGFPLAFILIVPALTMKAWAEEKKLGSMEILLTYPFSEWELVLGKFIACLAILFAFVLLTVPVPLTLSALAHFDPGVTVAEYAGILLLGASALALGLLLSSISRNQAAAFIGSVVVLLAVMLANNFTQRLPSSFADLINYVSLSFHFESFSRGLLDTRDVAFFLLSTFLFLFINTRVLIFRRWN